MEEVALLGAGEQQQVLDEAGHAVELVGDQRDRLAPLVRVVAEQLEVAADDRDRRAQLVAGVAHERLLGGERGLEAVEHGVERAGELGDLVAALDLDARVKSVSVIACAVRARGCAAARARGRRSPRRARRPCSSTASATPAATRTASVTSRRSWPRLTATTKTPRRRPSIATGTAR